MNFKLQNLNEWQKNQTIKVQGREITIITGQGNNYISLTDIARNKNEEATGLVISHWLSTKYTNEFTGLWEQMHNPVFKLYLIKEFQRLKEDENDRHKLEWNIQRTLAKVNYQIHTDAIKEKLIPAELSKSQINFVYANEADLLNMALFGMTAKQWRDANSW